MLHASRIRYSDTLIKIGEFMYAFSHLELSLRAYVKKVMGISDAHFEPLVANIDFTALVRIAVALTRLEVQDQARKKGLVDAINAMLPLADDRNALAHALWRTPAGEGSVRRLVAHRTSRSSGRPEVRFPRMLDFIKAINRIERANIAFIRQAGLAGTQIGDLVCVDRPGAEPLYQFVEDDPSYHEILDGELPTKQKTRRKVKGTPRDRGVGV